MLVTLLNISGIVAGVAWFAMLACLTPAFWRFMANRARFYDPLKSCLLLMIMNRLWYSSRRLMFGSHAEVMSSAEIIWWTMCSVMGLSCIVCLIYVLRRYDRMAQDGHR